MKFGETFTEYLHGEEEWFLEKCRYVEYKKLKKVLKKCKTCNSTRSDDEHIISSATSLSDSCQYQSCPWCDQMFFEELMKEAYDIAGCFKSRVRHLLHLHVATGMQRYMMRLRRCFTDEKQALIHEGHILIQYITMNAIAIRKILKKYDKVHGSENGKNFKLKMRAERIELLHSPWLIELGAFYLNSGLEKVGNFKNSFGRVSCENLNEDQPVMKLMLPNSIELEFDLVCAICLETVFNPYALKCGHIYCKACACSSASVMIFQGVKAAPQCSKCPICREVGVYAEAVHMIELHLLLKIRSKEYWKERMMGERSEMVKQSKMFWNEQTMQMIAPPAVQTPRTPPPPVKMASEEAPKSDVKENSGPRFFCVDKKSGQELACKPIAKRKLTTPEDVEDIRREIQIMHHLSGHPNVIQIVGAYEDAVAVHVVMEICAETFTDVVGNPYYVAPECDVWSAGVIIYILLSGVPPFWDEMEQGIFEQVLKGGLDFVSEPWPSVSESAKDLIRRMLIRDPKKRMKAHEVLCHPWARVDGVALDTPLDSAFLTRLTLFSAMNRLNKIAVKVIAESLSEEEIAGLKEMFKMIDADNTAMVQINKIEKEDHIGYITRDELQQACKQFGLADVHLDDILSEVDKDNVSKRFDYSEFVEMMQDTGFGKMGLVVS
ncbi:BnaA04g22260D [Brassica napus]|uniref:RING-type E3 ubiquitin transferase n=1 Tax=Brassica napus TaxID=3708 RepID=A0A078FZ89_BRANA|nr:BnaA04g22260D [Brassica napus]